MLVNIFLYAIRSFNISFFRKRLCVDSCQQTVYINHTHINFLDEIVVAFGAWNKLNCVVRKLSDSIWIRSEEKRGRLIGEPSALSEPVLSYDQKQHDFVDSKHFAVMLAEKANVIRMCSSLTPECIFHMDKKFTSIHKMSEYTRS